MSKGFLHSVCHASKKFMMAGQQLKRSTRQHVLCREFSKVFLQNIMIKNYIESLSSKRVRRRDLFESKQRYKMVNIMLFLLEEGSRYVTYIGIEVKICHGLDMRKTPW